MDTTESMVMLARDIPHNLQPPLERFQPQCLVYKPPIPMLAFQVLVTKDGVFAISGGLIYGIVLVVALILFGAILWRLIFSRGFRRKLEHALRDPEQAREWRAQETSITMSYWLIFFGFALFVIGVSGSLTLEIPGAKLVTSLPGFAVILLGYRLWGQTVRRRG